jgi:glycosyltransferase involved in cell wall biosynthesis
MISFVVPAYNEEAFIGGTLQAIHDSARAIGEPYEIVVADDASTDKTAEIALSHGARLEHVNHRQIAGTRNSGARASLGEFIFFVDADTLTNPRTLRSALNSMKSGAAGGGAITWFKRTEALPAYVWLGSTGGAVVPNSRGH